MYGLEADLFAQLVRLKKEFNIVYIKAEFETEGSSFYDLVRLRRLTATAGMQLILKISGCEAIRDLRDALELGVDGLVAPMIESPFGMKKFCHAVERIFRLGPLPRRGFNVETKTCLEHLEKILQVAAGRIDSLTIGRTDLCGSYLDPLLTTDSDFLLNQVEKIIHLASKQGWEIWLGGSLSQDSLAALSQKTAIRQHIRHFETRKVVIPSSVLWNRPQVLAEALRFEELWLLSRKQLLEEITTDDLVRLEMLKKRVDHE